MRIRRYVLAALVPATLGTAMFVSPAAAAPAKASEKSLEADIARLTNEQRTAKGCPAATVNAQLTAAARGHSEWMAETGTFSHTGRDNSRFVERAKVAGYARPSSENIAYGYRSADEVVKAWMKSPGHRANILNCKSKAVGVGAVYNAKGDAYYTQVFGF